VVGDGERGTKRERHPPRAPNRGKILIKDATTIDVGGESLARSRLARLKVYSGDRRGKQKSRESR